MFPSQTISVTSKGEKIKLHLFSTGAVAVKTKFRDAKRSGFAALVDFILDKNFTEWMPIWVMLIKHPEGLLLVDAGEISEVNNKDYFRSSGLIANWFDRSQFKFKITRGEAIDAQLKKIGISTNDVDTIFLTHLHFDHTDGIKYFPSAQILVNKYEWEKPFADLPKLYPSWFKPRPVELNDTFEVFEKAYYLTKARDVIVVQTPGHTYGHCSVIVKANEGIIFFAADICYSQEQLLGNKFPANNTSNALAQKTYDVIKQFASSNSIVFMPAHDLSATKRLASMEFLSI